MLSHVLVNKIVNSTAYVSNIKLSCQHTVSSLLHCCCCCEFNEDSMPHTAPTYWGKGMGLRHQWVYLTCFSHRAYLISTLISTRQTLANAGSKFDNMAEGFWVNFYRMEGHGATSSTSIYSRWSVFSHQTHLLPTNSGAGSRTEVSMTVISIRLKLNS